MKSHYISLFCLLLSCCAVFGQEGECEESELGYACKKQMTDYYALHWSLGPTTKGAEAEEGEIAIAMVAATEGWVGFAFAEEPGQMAPADFVIGYVDGEDVVVTPYRSEIQSITEDNEDDTVMLASIEGMEEVVDESTFTTIKFVRSLTEGTTEIVLDEEIPVNIATGAADVLGYHGPVTRMATTVMLSLADDGTEKTGPAPEPAPAVEEPAAEPVAEGPESVEDDGAPCTPSTLDYACMMDAGLVTVHWTAGPFDGEGSVPELSEGEIAMAISAETTGYVAVSFAEEAGEMTPADVILGWVDDEGVTINAYDISVQSISDADQSDEIGLTPGEGTEEDGITTIAFVLDGTFTFPVDLTETVNMNWAIGEGDELAYHGTDNRGSFTINFSAGETPAIGEPPESSTTPVEGPGEMDDEALEDDMEDF